MIKRRIAAFLSFILIFSSLSAIFVHAATAADIAREKTVLTAFCREFLRKRAEIEWLYAEHDLTPYLLPGDNNGLATPELSNFVKIMNFYRTWRLEVGKHRDSLTADRVVKEISIDGDTAHVLIREDLSYFITNGNGMPTSVSEDYELNIVKKEGRYYIESLDLPYDGFWFLHKTDGFDEAEMLAYFRETISGTGLPMLEVDTDVTGNSAPSGRILDKLPYYADYAVAYSNIYAYDGDGDVENSHCYNPNFVNFDRYGGDCANYTSQCVYAGFGGNDLSSEIKSAAYPMDTGGEHNWYNKGYSSYSRSWAGTLSVFSYARNVLTTRYEDGIVTRVFDVANKDVPYALPKGIDLTGSVMVVRGAGSLDYGHAILITSGMSDSFKDIYFSAHSSSKTNVCLAEYISGGSVVHPVRLIVPLYFRHYSTCSGHTYSATSAGFDSTCNRCGFSRMTPAQNWAVASKGETVKLSAAELGGLTPYSVELTVKDSKGNLLYKTTSLSGGSFTFTKDGLYTVTLKMTDCPGGVTETAVSTIRVPVK
ncbi:MAG: amidase domain-containing protein [Clostridia bacterium]|nr:amidase domain-containing protein [Clostridia bacterium]